MMKVGHGPTKQLYVYVSMYVHVCFLPDNHTAWNRLSLRVVLLFSAPMSKSSSSSVVRAVDWKFERPWFESQLDLKLFFECNIICTIIMDQYMHMCTSIIVIEQT